jgi:quercetin dioxygenase-like cupin family protein
MEPTVLYTPDSKGKAWSEVATNADVVTLRDDTSRGARSILVRLRAGGEVVAHAHAGPVQHFVLDGSVECDGKTLEAGTYVHYPAHSSFGRMTSKDGAELLILLDPEPR